ncbi:MAG: hypothetical protein R3C18_24550 [Planctomycetaceae bacterium]
MIRSIARHVGRFVLAVVLLVVLLCTVEVVMRVRRVRQHLQDETVSTDAELIRPSRTTFLEPVPLLDTVGGDAESVTIVTSEWGTRGKSPVLPKPVNTFRVLCLGGEETFARTLPEEETFCAQLATFLQQQTGRQVEVINAGCPTSSPLSQTLRLRQSLLQLQPDLVVFNLQSREVSLDPIVRGSLHLDENGHAAYAANPIYTASTNPLLASLKEEFATVDWVLGKTQSTLQDLSSKATPLSEEELGLSIDVLQEAQQLTNAQRAHCFVSLVPDTWETVPPSGSTVERATPQSIYSSLTAANGQQRIVFLDAVSSFRQHSQPRELFESNGKLSPAGHRLYAATLGQAILQQVSGGSNRPVPQYGEAPPTYRESEVVRRPVGQ